MRSAPEQAVIRRSDWLFYRRLWFFCHYFLGGTAILCSAAVVYLARLDVSNSWITILSMTAMLCNVLYYFIIPYKNAHSYATAWRKLDLAITNYEVDSNVPVNGILEALRAGEEHIEKHSV